MTDVAPVAEKLVRGAERPTSLPTPEEKQLWEWMLAAFIVLVVSILCAVIDGSLLHASAGELLTFVEIELLAFTVVVLLLLSRFTAQSFTRDAGVITSTFDLQSEALLSRSEAHWNEQTTSLQKAIEALSEVVKLETGVLEHSRRTMEVTGALLEIERAREQLRIDEAAARKQRIKPALAVRPVITHPGPIRKDIALEVFNQGSECRRIVFLLQVEGNPSLSQTLPRSQIAAFATVGVGFGNIDDWPDSFRFALIVQADDVDGTRYEWRSTPVSYDRNRGLLGSDPSFVSSDWQYPATMELP